MKTKYLIGIIVLIGGILAACEKDNYDAPNGGLYGLICAIAGRRFNGNDY